MNITPVLPVWLAGCRLAAGHNDVPAKFVLGQIPIWSETLEKTKASITWAYYDHMTKCPGLTMGLLTPTHSIRESNDAASQITDTILGRPKRWWEEQDT